MVNGQHALILPMLGTRTIILGRMEYEESRAAIRIKTAHEECRTSYVFTKRDVENVH